MLPLFRRDHDESSDRMKRQLQSWWSLRIMTAFYILAGLNHFLNPAFYLPLIPDGLPYPELINIAAGFAELLLGLGLMLPAIRSISAYLIIIMLLAFVPSHVHFIKVGSCTESLCVSPWIAWARLLIVHPFLIYWAFNVQATGSPSEKRS